MPSRPASARRCCAWLLAAAGLAACGSESDDIAATGDGRAEQVRAAALEAGLKHEVADFLALLAQGETATYQVRFPGPAEDTELLIANRPPDRRVEVIVDGTTTEVRVVTDGQAFTCTPEQEPGDPLACERTDALVDPPGVFRTGALKELRESLADRADDYTFDIEALPVAGIEAQCLVTRLRSGHEAADRGASGTICASPEGAVVLVDQGDDRLEAIEYRTAVDDASFVRPDQAEDPDAG